MNHYKMASASINHQRICTNVASELGNQLKGSSCEAPDSDVTDIPQFI